MRETDGQNANGPIDAVQCGDMYTVLLSGGSGKRLWPLSNDLRSKQYIKLLTYENSDQACSMVQRVMRQLDTAGMAQNTVICASAGQVEMLRSQLGNVHIAVEPTRRDTFPAIMLACAYLVSEMKATPNDVVCVLPVDPYTESRYFETLGKLNTVIHTNAQTQIALMGATPTYASTKYGYIVPDGTMHEGLVFDCYGVARFQEKPDEATAQSLLAQNALWNCGVFCFRIGEMLRRCCAYGLEPAYDVLYSHYDCLPKNSFDYEVLEKARHLAVVPFTGLWKDLGTWNTLTDEMHSQTTGLVMMDTQCERTHIINELNIPVVALGVCNLVAVATYDGILIADKEDCAAIKNMIQDVSLQPMYEERRWGTIKTIDISTVDQKATITRKITIFKGMNSSYHFHNKRDEIWTVMRGSAELILEGASMMLQEGSAITIRRGQKHAVRAMEEFEYIEIHVGEEVGDQDINRITFDWGAVPRAQLL
jgi:mannose-1-phosphate guanylyltransferase